MNEDQQPPESRYSKLVDTQMGEVRDNEGNEVYAKSLGQRHVIRQAREDEWEEFCQRNEAPPCGPDCACMKFSTK